MGEPGITTIAPATATDGRAQPGTVATVLVVDDERSIRRMVCRILEQDGYRTEEASDSNQARTLLTRDCFDAILIDARMPGESGLDLLRHVRRAHCDTAPIMVTAFEDQDLIDAAFESGAFGYVLKPFRARDLLINVTNALHRRRDEISKRTQIEALEANVAEKTRRLQQAIMPLPDPDLVSVSVEEVIGELSRVVTVRDEETGEHILRMSHYAALLAERAGLAGEHIQRIRLASALHDVGKIGIPDSVLLKPGPLSPGEFAVMQTHTVIGHRILAGSQSPLLRLGAAIALNHHERWDGGGYPNGIAGVAIPAEARVASVADVFDALTSDRCYRPAMSVDQAIAIMKGGRGTQFDPDLLDVFLASLDGILELRELHREPIR